MDIPLAGTDGLAAAGLLRAAPTPRDLASLAVTAHAMRGHEKPIVEARCKVFTPNPVADKELLAAGGRLPCAGPSEGPDHRGPSS